MAPVLPYPTLSRYAETTQDILAAFQHTSKLGKRRYDPRVRGQYHFVVLSLKRQMMDAAVAAAFAIHHKNIPTLRKEAHERHRLRHGGPGSQVP